VKVQFLVVHHSASDRSNTTKEKIDKWHKKKGWNGIGYHKVIEGNGAIKNGRSESIQGAHALGVNARSLGVCVVGNFEKEIPTPSQINSLVRVLTNWCIIYGLDEKAIYGHYNVPGGTTPTACPGTNLKSKLPMIKAQVKANLFNLNKAIERAIKSIDFKKLLNGVMKSYYPYHYILKSKRSKRRLRGTHRN